MFPLALLLPLIASFLAISILPEARSIGHEADYDVAIRKGRQLYQDLRSGCYPDKPNPPKLRDLLAVGWIVGDAYATHWPPGPSEFIRDSALDPRFSELFDWKRVSRDGIGAFWRSDIYGSSSRGGFSESYSTEFSPVNRLVTHMFSDGPSDHMSHWTDIAFAMWEALTSYMRADIRQLRYIGRYGVEDFALRIVNHILGDDENIRTFQAPSTEFLALLGTPDGAESVNFLMEHKQQLGYKTITKAVVILKADDGSAIVFVVQDMQPPNFDRAMIGNRSSLHGGANLCPSLILLSNGAFSNSTGDADYS